MPSAGHFFGIEICMNRHELVLKKLGIEITGRRANQLYARCPMHDDLSRHKNGDRNPSWSIEITTGMHHCFSCKYGGSILQLISEKLEIGEFEAKLFLDSIEDQTSQVAIDAITVTIKSRKRSSFRLPSEVVFRPFAEWHKMPARYVLSRRLTPKQIDRWGIGYATQGVLQGRIVLPVRNQHNEIVNYAARTFVDDEKRYLAADARSHFDPSVLFGESRWLELYDLKSAFVVVCEGILNALAIERACAGVAVAALCGSNVHARHIAKLAKFGKIIVATDPDPAGDKAADQLIFALGRYARVARMRLPVDACDYEQAHGSAELLRRVFETF